jgi:hypothetical protein
MCRKLHAVRARAYQDPIGCCRYAMLAAASAGALNQCARHAVGVIASARGV